MQRREHPTVSVVMPVYNCEKSLGRAVQSILDQTFTDLELIAVDDGSTDGSAAVLRGFVDDRIVVLSQENAGYPSAMKAGVAIARGRYIARMDADDISMDKRIAEQVAFLDAHPEYGLVGTRYARVTPRGALWIPTEPLPSGESSTVTFEDVFTGHKGFADPSTMFRADAARQVGGYRTYQRSAQDIDLWLRIMESGPKAAVLNRYLYRMRISTASITSRSGTAAMARIPRILAEQRRQQCTDVVMRGGSVAGLLTEQMYTEAHYWFVWDPWHKARVCLEAGDLLSACQFILHGLYRGKLTRDNAGHALGLARMIVVRVAKKCRERFSRSRAGSKAHDGEPRTPIAVAGQGTRE